MKSKEIAPEIAKAPMSIEDKLSWHLTLFSRSVPETMIPVLVEAIEIVNANGDIDQLLELPDEVQFRHSSRVSVGTLVEQFRLDYYTNPKEVSGE
ncbi:hypothetical protein UFOVP325_58 [uncultured Caudovirales phage]|uniref:Uncharacterized protein n=1 Tax=uncultured Caudovirales phage TaxID=2100421 RepID=A0A6J5MW70_9CAUD|nr:hypothetical protein UFOVP325_58 [uncultured Caudovirales phage]CAB4147929.1 hypothetical protein UFOVP430_53 [uncultured Caudovirales phage]